MNATLKSSGIKDKLDIPTKGDSDETLKIEIDLATDSRSQTIIAEHQLTPANQVAKVILLSLLARYD